MRKSVRNKCLSFAKPLQAKLPLAIKYLKAIKVYVDQKDMTCGIINRLGFFLTFENFLENKILKTFLALYCINILISRWFHP